MYDIPFAAETYAQGDEPSLDYCIAAAEGRFSYLKDTLEFKDYKMYFTGKNNFRHDIATIIPYKGTRGNKPKLYDIMKDWMKFKFDTVEIEGMEADDMLAIRQKELGHTSVIVSRDKDLRMVEGWHYGYACGKQPEFPLRWIDKLGYLEYYKSKTLGGGLKFFYAQLIMGDRVDNIQGVKGKGAKAAYETIKDCETEEEMYSKVLELYKEHGTIDDPEAELLENARLLWMVNELNEDGSPVMWTPPKILEEA